MEIILGNIYTLNEDQPLFFAQIIEGIETLGCPLRILGGYFNMVLNVYIDKRSSLDQKRNSREKYCYNIWKKQAFVIYGGRITLNVSDLHGVEESVWVELIILWFQKDF